MSLKLKDLYFQTRQTLQDGGIENADLVARDFVKQSVDIADIDLILKSEKDVPEEKVVIVQEGVRRKLAGEPITRIFGETEFWGIPMKVTPDVLDPRPDTETIVDAAVKKYFGNPPERILDLGTGSGCLAIALLTEWPKCNGVAVDVCEKALAVAATNAKAAKVESRLQLIESDWCESVKGKFDLIVSNPPYITNQEMTNLPPEVKNFDPILALSGGDDGLDCYRIIVTEIKKIMKPDGICLLEVGFSQAENLSRLVEDSGLFVNAVHPDIAGIPRVVEISFGEK